MKSFKKIIFLTYLTKYLRLGLRISSVRTATVCIERVVEVLGSEAEAVVLTIVVDVLNVVNSLLGVASIKGAGVDLGGACVDSRGAGVDSSVAGVDSAGAAVDPRGTGVDSGLYGVDLGGTGVDSGAGVTDFINLEEFVVDVRVLGSED